MATALERSARERFILARSLELLREYDPWMPGIIDERRRQAEREWCKE